MDLCLRLRILGVNLTFFDQIDPGKIADYVCLDNHDAVIALLDQAEKNAAGKPDLLPRIRRERVSLDFGLLERRDFLAGPEILPDRELTKRLRKNFQEACSHTIMSEQAVWKNQRWLENYLLGKKIRVALPDQFKNRTVLNDYTWNKISSKSRRVGLSDDPDAAGGKCFRATDPENRNRTVSLGVYSPSGKKHIRNLKLKRISPDGRYHYYSTGKFHLTNDCFIWVHWSWNIQAVISEFYDKSGLNNLVEAFVSVKTEFKNGKSIFSVDRIILIRAD